MSMDPGRTVQKNRTIVAFDDASVVFVKVTDDDGFAALQRVQQLYQPARADVASTQRLGAATVQPPQA